MYFNAAHAASRNFVYRENKKINKKKKKILTLFLNLP